MKNILFVCTGNSARSIIAESIVNNKYNDKFKAYSAGSNPTGEINKDIKHYLSSKGFNLQDYSSKNFSKFINGEIKIGSKVHDKVKDSTLILLENGKDLKVKASSNSKFLLVSGKPLNEDIARGGPFVMNTKKEILEAVNDYHNGTFVK